MNQRMQSNRLRSDHQEVRPLAGLKVIGIILGILGWLHPGLASRLMFWVFSIPGKKAKHFKEDALLTSAKRGWISTQHGRIRTYTWGQETRKVLLCHGWQSRGTALRYLVPMFLSKGVTIVAMDGPGHGESDGYRMLLPTYAETIQSVDAHLGPFQMAVTHSFGGRALTYALGFLPHDWQIERVVMLAVPASLSEIFGAFFQQINASPRLIAAAKARIIHVLKRPLADSEIYNMGHLLKARICIIHDENDEIVPMAEAERIAQSLPECQLLKTSGLGHYRLVKSLQVQAYIKDFLFPETRIDER